MILGRFWMLESMNTALVKDVRAVRTAAVVTASKNIWSVNMLFDLKTGLRKSIVDGL